MRISDVIRRSGRSLKQAKARTILTALAIAVGAFALTLTLAASNGAQNFVNKIIADNFDPAELIVTNDKAVFGRADTTTPKEYSDNFGKLGDAGTSVRRLAASDIDVLRQVEGVEQVREGVLLDFKYIQGPNGKKFLGGAAAFSPAQNPTLVTGTIPKPLSNKQVLIPEAYMGVMGFASAEEAVGKTITVAIQPKSGLDVGSLLSSDNLSQALAAAQQQSELNTKMITFTITGVMKRPTTSQPGTELYLFMGVDDAKEIDDLVKAGTNDYRQYVYAYVRVKNGKDKAALTTVQDRIKARGYEAQSVEDTQKFLTQIITVLQGIVAGFGFIAIIASLFGVINTMYISVLQRTREIGLMKALGMRRKDISRLFRVEAAWIGFLGGVIGSGLAVLLGASLNPWITKKLQLDGEHLLIFKPVQIIGLIVILMLVAVFAGLLPSRKAAKLDPIEALRTE